MSGNRDGIIILGASGEERISLTLALGFTILSILRQDRAALSVSRNAGNVSSSVLDTHAMNTVFDNSVILKNTEYHVPCLLL